MDVLRVLVVAVAGHLAVGPVVDVGRAVGESVPDAQSFATLVPAALDLWNTHAPLMSYQCTMDMVSQSDSGFILLMDQVHTWYEAVATPQRKPSGKES